jgi:hypothetical protein
MLFHLQRLLCRIKANGKIIMNVEKVNTWREVDVGWHSPEKPQNLSQDNW